MLRTAMGDVLASALADPNVFEILVNPDGTVRFDKAGEGRVPGGLSMPAADSERIIRLVASHVRIEIDSERPIVSAELPMASDGTGGERFEGILPPVARAPCFSIRKPAYRLFALEDYVAIGAMTVAQARALRRAVRYRENILVVGGTSSGKTTLTNALLAEVAELQERVIVIEDTRELRCAAEDVVELRTRPHHVTIGDLVRSTLRLRPDRIIVGEVRGAEALDLLKAWNTGHPGGIATLHANSARGALFRLEQLIQEAVTNVPKALIAEAVDVIVFIQGANALSRTPRHVAEIIEVLGLDARGDYDLRPVLRPGEDPDTTPFNP
ncbi:P-type conjugative transfer ATPase TrbB [Asticcacaulis sp. SL142]|uniref:P-type conjugative transfer ATPase TrbB n=1 Tax=Asticcacaulis sp. SL142 TaxID=2995155 RepID=UPI00226D2052|nr:P-type conjugative transfer ATPase TrbB [Asticcacaulis sp. SL142]WAC48207.1 P-type conjugative transfer ATPase TrbB [Asticcacaulis sp. SL142]